MCKPIAGNFVRMRSDCQLKPMEGSVGLKSLEKNVTIGPTTLGMVDDVEAADPEDRIVLFEFDRATVRAQVPCSMLKGVEL